LDAAELPPFAAVILEVGVEMAVKIAAPDVREGGTDFQERTEMALEDIFAGGESLLFRGG
jgi:hypothetical protein